MALTGEQAGRGIGIVPTDAGNETERVPAENDTGTACQGGEQCGQGQGAKVSLADLHAAMQADAHQEHEDDEFVDGIRNGELAAAGGEHHAAEQEGERGRLQLFQETRSKSGQ